MIEFINVANTAATAITANFKNAAKTMTQPQMDAVTANQKTLATMSSDIGELFTKMGKNQVMGELEAE